MTGHPREQYPEWRGVYDNVRNHGQEHGRPPLRHQADMLGQQACDWAKHPLAADPRDYLDEEIDTAGHQCGLYLVARPGSMGDSTAAIEECYTDIGGRMWAGNGEYVSQVNYCPRCDAKARVQGEEAQ